MSDALDLVTWPVTTERLVLRPAVAEDAGEVFRIRAQPGVSDWLTRIPTDPEEWRTTFAEPDRLARSLVYTHDDRIVGDLMLLVSSPWAQAEVREQARDRQAELGWVLDPAYGGRGLATEAVRAVLGVCFEQLDVHRVAASCLAGNTASWRLMERVGMRRERHVVRAELLRDGTWSDAYGYAILREEWT